MVGGTVIDHIVLNDKIWVNYKEDCSKDTCAIYLEKNLKSRCISEGDMVWWQGSNANWTPKFNRVREEEGIKLGHKSGIDYDIQIKRIGFSGVGRPKEEINL